MNIMDKPTLQEVKEYFKNAKEVKGRIVETFDISELLDSIYWYEDAYVVINNDWICHVWDKTGYLEIISYKEPLYKLTSKEVVHAFENPQWLKDTFKECFETELEQSTEKEIKIVIKIYNL